MESKTVPALDVPQTPDSDAEKEEELFGDGDLEQARKKNDHNDLGRADRLRQHIFNASVAAIWILFGIVVVTILSLTWHYIAPVKCQWLSEEQVSFIKGAMLSGGGGALLSTVMNH